MTHHRHQPNTTATIGYRACVDPYTRGSGCRPSSHGGVEHIDTCACGATRRRNGCQTIERGPWVPAEAAEEAHDAVSSHDHD
jgi:hypothetical protein